MSSVYRDGVSYPLDKGSKVKTRVTGDGHIVEHWKSNGKRIYFANLADSVYCAHGESEADAVAEAIWKDPTKRPSIDALVKEIKPNLETRKITVKEFRILTGACETGCKQFLSQHGLPLDTAMTLKEFKPIGGQWAVKLEQALK